MLSIEKICMSIPETPISERVHPFYASSIKSLFGVELSENSVQSLTRNRNCLVTALKKLLDADTYNFSYFIDIRLQEELGSPSPQYEILYDLGLTNVTPLCIHGDDISIVKESFQLVDSLLCDGEQALCTISLLSCAKWQYDGEEFVIALIVRAKG